MPLWERGEQKYLPFLKGGRRDYGDRGIEKWPTPKTNVLFYNTKLKKYARELRKNTTDAEKLLWSKVRRKQLKGLQVYRQRIVGNYIVDFYCPKANLVIEIDGGQHYTDKGIEQDKTRDDYIKSQGLKVLRFSDEEVLANLNGVVERIFENL